MCDRLARAARSALGGRRPGAEGGYAVYSRVLLKLSGESFSGDQGHGVDHETVQRIARAVADVHDAGIETAIVIGAGNILRGAWFANRGMDRPTADYAGMVATVINCLVLQDTLEDMGVVTRVQSAIEMRQVAEPFIRRRAQRHLEKGRVVIFGAGTGNPFFTTDTAAVLRAAEIGAEVVIKCTNVDGVYDSDPKKNPNAQKYDRIGYDEAIAQDLKVMDITALALAKDRGLPVLVVSIADPDNIRRAALGESVGSTVGRVSHGEGDR